VHLPGQGGPSGKLPWYTQLVVLLTGIFSVAMFAIPASMLTWGFEAEAERLGRRAKDRAMARRRGEVYISETSSSSSESSDVSGYGDLSTSDEEVCVLHLRKIPFMHLTFPALSFSLQYMRIIGGDDDDEEEEEDNSSNRSNGQRIPTPLLRNEELQSIMRRIDSMEQSLAQTNKKLDIILQKLENKGDARPQRY